MVTLKDAFRELFNPAMTRSMFFLDFYVYPALIILCLFLAFNPYQDSEVPEVLGLVLLGYMAWTVIEYVVHRFILHHVAAFRELHKAHHDASCELVGTPTIISVSAFYFLGYLPIAEISGGTTAAALLAGLLTGYLSYVVVHYALHHVGSHGYRFVKRLKRRHALHHQSESINFGVTTAIWDRALGTFADQI
jgi:sterol desaturase/sphingolipid hydroxylase (fatty acid hydroxylase superfamily)